MGPETKEYLLTLENGVEVTLVIELEASESMPPLVMTAEGFLVIKTDKGVCYYNHDHVVSLEPLEVVNPNA